MSGGVALAAGAALVVARVQPGSWPLAAPFLLLWALSPVIARRASLPRGFAGAAPLSDIDARSLRLVARRTWRFFETFITAGDHALPPDNFQEDPAPVVAHRTSPTNIGLYVLSVIAARDFGWLGTLDAVDRLEATLATLSSLERFHGHFYNWYDTRDLRPLEPKFISAVDSGNLAGHLIALGAACRQMATGPPVAIDRRTGVQDGLQITRESLQLLTDDRRTHTVTRTHLHGRPRCPVPRRGRTRRIRRGSRPRRDDGPRRHGRRHRANVERRTGRPGQRRCPGLRHRRADLDRRPPARSRSVGLRPQRVTARNARCAPGCPGRSD